MDDTVVITLFRHGVTEDNMRRAFLGWNDSPLTQNAERELAAYQFSPLSYDLFVSSDLQRCLATMKLLFPKVEPVTLQEFREMCFGDFEGKTNEEMKEWKEYQQWMSDWTSLPIPNGESFLQFTNRVQEGWNKLLQLIEEKNARSPFITTHGGVIRTLLTRFVDDKKDFWDWNVPHGSGYQLTFQRDDLRRGNRCTLLQAVPLTAKENG